MLAAHRRRQPCWSVAQLAATAWSGGTGERFLLPGEYAAGVVICLGISTYRPEQAGCGLPNRGEQRYAQQARRKRFCGSLSPDHQW